MSLKDKIILLVDDDHDYLFQQRFYLEELGATVLSAQTKKEAKERIENEDFDLAIVDLMMEEMDAGVVLAHTIKKKNPLIPVVMVTGVSTQSKIHFDLQTKGERRWMQVDNLLSKPVRSEQLKEIALRYL